MKEPTFVTLKMTKKEIYNAGKENFFKYISLLDEFEQLKITNASLINSLRFILKNVPQIQFAFEDDEVEDEPVSKPKQKTDSVEVQ